MRRRPLVLVAVGLAAAAATLIATREDGVPTLRLQRRRFVRRVVAEGHLTAARSTPLIVPLDSPQAVKIAWMIPDGSRVAEGDPVVRFDPTELEERLEVGRSDRSAAGQKIARTEVMRDAKLANLDRDAELSDEQLESARRFQSKDAEIYSRFEIISSEIDTGLASSRKEHAESVRRTEEGVAAAELELLEIERRKAELAIRRAEQGLSALELQAPHAGIVVYRRDWRGNQPRVGDQMWPGSKVGELPDLDTMEAEIWVLEADAGGLEVGRRATVLVESRPGTEVSATVKRVDALAKPRRRGVPVQYFGATLELGETDPTWMKPGQRVTVTLILDEIDGALVVPLQAVFERDGRKIVYRRGAGGFESIPVELRAVSLGEAVVEDGLTEGDRIALTDPFAGSVEAAPTAGAGGPLVGAGR